MHSELLHPQQLLTPPGDSCGLPREPSLGVQCVHLRPADAGRFAVWSVAIGRQDSVGQKRPEDIGAFGFVDG